MQQPQHIYNDLNTSFTLEGTDISYDSDSTFHIYNELQYPLQPSNSPAMNIQTNKNVNPTTGIIYGFRTRHLSCIEENDSDSLHSSSVPKPAIEMIQDVDEKFKKLVSTEMNTSISSWPEAGEDEVDHMVMIDESRLFDLDYLDELSVSQVVAKDAEEEERFDMNASEVMWQSTVSEPAHRSRFSTGRSNIPDIMTTSCYGALNTSFGSETSGPPAYSEQNTPTKQHTPNKPEPIYATPEKRRECNRSFDSSCPSQSSSLYGGSMTSSLDLKCMSASGLGANSFGLTRITNNINTLDISNNSMDHSKSDWNSTGDSGAVFGMISPAEDVSEEMAMQCITAAENGKLLQFYYFFYFFLCVHMRHDSLCSW